jgi:nucleoid-associated protein YgaU
MKITRLHLLLVLIIAISLGIYGLRRYKEIVRLKEQELRVETGREQKLKKMVLEQSAILQQRMAKESLLAKEAVAVAGEYYKIAKQQGKIIDPGQGILRQAKEVLLRGQYEPARILAHQAIEAFRNAPAAEMKYKVRRGDCLWNIAAMKRHYRRGFFWPVIYRANKTEIHNPRLIYPRQVFRIPKSNLKKYLTGRELRRWGKYISEIGGE